MTTSYPPDAAAGESRDRPAGRPRVVIVGAGFGGLEAAKALASAPVDVLVVDRRNHHLFQPLLYQVATAALSPAEVAWPIRRILRKQRNARVLMADVTGIDVERREVLLGERREPWDFLVVATGATHSWFGNEAWAPYAPGLKTIRDATAIRHRILCAFERAEAEDDPAAIERLRTFVIVGGGPTGVEMAGAVAELALKSLPADFRRIDTRKARVLLIEAGPRVLPTFPEPLSRYAQRALEALGVEVRVGAPVTACDAGGVAIGDERIPSATVVWAAGVAASPAAHWLGAEADRAGRVVVEPDFSVPGRPDVFVIGDTALARDAEGRPLPGVAPVAKQEGAWVGRLIAQRVLGRAAPRPFRYRDAGQLATIGRRAAVADFGWLRLKGWIAWWFWGIVHIYFLIGVRSRMIVALEWFWSYLTYDRGARLIVDP
ncbi:MAG TPA: NAD(P)/FAD-dependent oxidoreductase [Woeseiaceae bacterium]|nr:NAD(P)/FAD-dependent oxidoreductase [Woeseiaceae bacterium]